MLVIGHGADDVRTALAGRTGPRVRRPVAAAGHRSCAAAGRAGPGGEDAAPSCFCTRTCRCSRQRRSRRLLETHHVRARGCDGAHHRRGRSVRLRPNRSRRMPARSRASSRNATPQATSARSRKSTAASTRFALEPLFASLHAAGDRQRAGRVLPDRSRRHVSAARAFVSRRCVSIAPDELRGVNTPRRSRRDLGRPSRAQEPRADARRRDARGSGHDLRSTTTSRSGRTRSSAREWRCRAGRRSAAAAGFTPNVRLTNATIGDDVTILDHSVIVDSTRGARAHPSGRSPTSGRDRSSKRTRRVGNFVELKKTRLGPGSKANHLAYLGDATIGERRQHRRRHDHLQLRRRQQASDGDRRRRLHRQRLAAHRAGDDREGRLRGGGIVDHRGRAPRRARHRARRARRTRPMGRAAGAARENGHSAGARASRKKETR